MVMCQKSEESHDVNNATHLANRGVFAAQTKGILPGWPTAGP